MIRPRKIPAPWAAALAWLTASAAALAMAEDRAALASGTTAWPVAVRPGGLAAEQHHAAEGACGPLPGLTEPVAGPAGSAATPPPVRTAMAPTDGLAAGAAR